MKTHTLIGAKMIENLEGFQEEPLVKVTYAICRWHHERWDGRGYPDGLKGDDIPISAQLVALADVYDALELLPWVRSFIGRIISFESDNEFARKRFYDDLNPARSSRILSRRKNIGLRCSPQYARRYSRPVWVLT